MDNFGITPEMVSEWKQKYGDVYQVILSGTAYVYRPLKRVEYKQILALPDTNRSYSEEQIVQKCLIYPKTDVATLGAEKAGTATTLTELIMVASNFGVAEEPIKL